MAWIFRGWTLMFWVPLVASAAFGWRALGSGILARPVPVVVFLWFGIIKFVPNWSPAAELATRTIERLTFGVVPPTMSLPLLAGWETLMVGATVRGG